MIRFSFILFFIFSNSICYGVSPDTIELSRKMIGLIQKAKDCAITSKKDSVHFCTGITLSKKDLDFLKGLNERSCKQFIQQMEYTVHNSKDKKTLERAKKDSAFKEMLDDFEKSTKLAFIDYDLKVVLFKPSAQVGDCIHEIIHFYQHNRPTDSELSPKVRGELQNKLQALLEKEVEVVASWERKGNKEKATELASQLGPLIQLQKEWIKLVDWLDEKEVYEFMFEYYDDLGLSARDFDIAVSNLVRLQYALDWRWMQKALFYANQLLNKKYAEVEANLKDVKTEREYNELYNSGKISRAEFERKVIAQRKGMALLDYKKAKSLKDQMSALIRGRFFEKEKKLVYGDKELSYYVREDLPYVDLELALTDGKKIRLPMLIDLGAQQTIIPVSIIEHAISEYQYPNHNGKLQIVGEKKIQNGHTGSEQVPLVQVNFPLELGDKKLESMTFALSSSPFFLKFGILGIDFFQKSHGSWSWNFSDKKIVMTKKVTPSMKLMENGLGQYDALEFYCRNNDQIQVRIDSGSQVFGDYSRDISKKDLRGCVHSQAIEKLTPLPAQQIYFSRGVDINLGFLYISQYYKSIQFDLNKGLIDFVQIKEEL